MGGVVLFFLYLYCFFVLGNEKIDVYKTSKKIDYFLQWDSMFALLDGIYDFFFAAASIMVSRRVFRRCYADRHVGYTSRRIENSIL